MKIKWMLFTGIALLTLGIVLKKTSDLGLISTLLIIIGALFKVVYLIAKVRRGEYKPGVELLFLILGLLLLYFGVYLRSHESSINPSYFIGTGITFKVIFIFLAIRKIRAFRKKE
jgi:hypothetical protein